MAHQTISDDALAESLFEVFRHHGFEGASIQQLSLATGLKKSSLYHRFPAGKEDMARAVVSYVLSKVQQLVLIPLLDKSTSPEQRFQNMIDVLHVFYADGEKNCLLNVLTLGDTNPAIRDLLKQGYQAWIDALTRLAMEAGLLNDQAELRARHFLVMLEGSLVIQRLTVDNKSFTENMRYAQHMFFSD